MSRQTAPMGSAEWSFLFVLSILWGGSFLFGKIAVAEIPPMTLVFVRVAIAALVLIAVVGAMGLNPFATTTGWWPLAVMALLNNVVPFTLFFWGMTRLNSGLAAILNATTPLFTVLLAHMLIADERLTTGRIAGVLLGLAGVVILIGLDALTGMGQSVLAQLACLAGAVSYAVSGIWGRRFAGQRPVITAAGQLAMSAAIMFPLVIVIDRPWTLESPSPQAVWSAIGLAVGSTALAYVIFFRILRTAGATNLLLVTFLIPVSALLLGSAVLGERVTMNALAGMALIGLGLAAIDGRPFKALARLLHARRGYSRKPAP